MDLFALIDFLHLFVKSWQEGFSKVTILKDHPFSIFDWWFNGFESGWSLALTQWDDAHIFRFFSLIFSKSDQILKRIGSDRKDKSQRYFIQSIIEDLLHCWWGRVNKNFPQGRLYEIADSFNSKFWFKHFHKQKVLERRYGSMVFDKILRLCVF